MTQQTEDEGTGKVGAKDVAQRAAGKVLVASQQCPGGSSTKTAALESRGLQLAVTGAPGQVEPSNAHLLAAFQLWAGHSNSQGLFSQADF